MTPEQPPDEGENISGEHEEADELEEGEDQALLFVDDPDDDPDPPPGEPAPAKPTPGESRLVRLQLLYGRRPPS